MEKGYKKYLFNWRTLGLAFLVAILVVLSTIAGNTTSLYVNGKDVTNQGQPTYRGGVLYVPVEPVVTGMGDSFQYVSKPTSALITKKDGTKIQVSVTKSTAVVNGKLIPVSTQKLKDTKVPIQAKPVVVNGKLYVPSDFVTSILKYPLETQKVGKIEYVFVGTKPAQIPTQSTPVTPTPTPAPSGKLDLPYKVPAGWTPPQIKSVATEDRAKNYEILEKELGLIKGAYFSPYGGTRIEESTIMVTSGGENSGYYTRLVFYSWYGSKTGEDIENKTPYIARELFRFYFSHDYNKVFTLMDQGLTGKLDTSKFLNKTFTYNGRKVVIKQIGESINMFISNK